MKLKGIIFDKDGTLMDYEMFWINIAEYAIKDILKNTGQSEGLLEKMLEAIGAYEGISGLLCYGTYRQISKVLYSVLIDNKADIDEKSIYEMTVEAFNKNTDFGNIVPVCENITGIFKYLHSKNIRIALVTTDNMYITEKCLRTLGIYDYFDRIYADDGVNPTKPNPYYIYEFCREENLETRDVVMVGDTLTDMQFAKNGGIKFIGVAKSDTDKQILGENTDCVISDISYLSDVLE